MIGKNIAPGLSRSFASEEWEAIPGNLWKEERKKAFNAINNDVQLKIFGSDINPQAVKAARLNAEEAGVDDCIKFYTADVSALRTKSERGVLITNPPYGQRIREQEAIDKIYQSYSRFFKENPTWSLFVITADKTIEKKAMGRPAERRRKLYNGRLEVCYYQFHGEKPKRQIMNVKIDEKSKIPVYLQLSNQLKKEILSGKLPIGSILPSERAMAQFLGVHRNTVARAYNELKAEELIDSRQGVGYEVQDGRMVGRG